MSKELITALGKWADWITVRPHKPPNPLKIVLKAEVEGDASAYMLAELAKKVDPKLIGIEWLHNKELNRTVAVLSFPEGILKALQGKKAETKPTCPPIHPLNPFANNPPDAEYYSHWPRRMAEFKPDDSTEVRFSLLEWE